MSYLTSAIIKSNEYVVYKCLQIELSQHRKHSFTTKVLHLSEHNIYGNEFAIL